MRESSQFMHGFQCTMALNSGFPTHEEQDCCADENDGANARLECLDEIGVIFKIELPDVDQHENE